MKKNKIVSVIYKPGSKYPDFPYNPPKKYPEFSSLRGVNLDKNNDVYEMVRKSLINLGLDSKKIGGKNWNPFKNLVKKGDSVVLKPNLVIDTHPLGKKGIEAMLTNASVIRPIIDYLLLATDGNIKITICDVSLQSTNWDNLVKITNLSKLVDFYKEKGIKISLIDLRFEIALKNNEGIYFKKIKKIRDPLGYQIVSLGKKSFLQGIIKDSKKLEITDYGFGTVSKHHNADKNEYLLAKTILNADLFVNFPKLKTHKKAGVTLSMKNIIGTNADKSWIAHHRRGIDEYPKFNFKDWFKWYFSYFSKIYLPKPIVTLIYKTYRKLFLKTTSMSKHVMTHGSSLMEGNWHGNDTLWRTILDLNNVIFLADKNGKMKNTQQRKYLSIIDGIIGMEKEGPMHGFPKKAGLIIAGTNPIYTDYISTYLMGIDPKKIKYIKESLNANSGIFNNLRAEDIKVVSNFEWVNFNKKFIPSKGWIGYCERS